MAGAGALGCWARPCRARRPLRRGLRGLWATDSSVPAVFLSLARFSVTTRHPVPAQQRQRGPHVGDRLEGRTAGARGGDGGPRHGLRALHTDLTLAAPLSVGRPGTSRQLLAERAPSPPAPRPEAGGASGALACSPAPGRRSRLTPLAFSTGASRKRVVGSACVSPAARGTRARGRPFTASTSEGVCTELLLSALSSSSSLLSFPARPGLWFSVSAWRHRRPRSSRTLAS